MGLSFLLLKTQKHQDVRFRRTRLELLQKMHGRRYSLMRYYSRFSLPTRYCQVQNQAMPGMYKGVGDGFSQIYKTEGMVGFSTGFIPTWIGYSFQGFGKFGFYEMFKDVYRGAAGSEENIKKYQTLGFAVSPACAEIIADCFLCPWEALKVKMQTAEPGTFTTSTVKGLKTINESEGINGFYKGLKPLWARQIPYTIIKFVCFEKIVA